VVRQTRQKKKGGRVSYLDFEIQITDKIESWALYCGNIAQLHKHGPEQNTACVDIGHGDEVILPWSIGEGNFDLALHQGCSAIAKEFGLWLQVTQDCEVVLWAGEVIG